MSPKGQEARFKRQGRRYTLAFRNSVMIEVDRIGVSAACRKFKISRTTCHAWKKRWNPDDPLSLADPPRTIRKHPFAISTEMAETILAVSAENPKWGCKRLSAYMAMLENPVSSPTVQKVLLRADRGRLEQRLKTPVAGT